MKSPIEHLRNLSATYRKRMSVADQAAKNIRKTAAAAKAAVNQGGK